MADSDFQNEFFTLVYSYYDAASDSIKMWMRIVDCESIESLLFNFSVCQVGKKKHIWKCWILSGTIDCYVNSLHD